MPARALPRLSPDHNRGANLPRGPSSHSSPRVLRPAAARRYASSNSQTKTPAAKTTRRTNPRHANQGPYFQSRPLTMRAQRGASESGRNHVACFATLPKVTAAATNAQDQLHPATALRHLTKKAHADMLRSMLPKRQRSNQNNGELALPRRSIEDAS